jgi:hypothetical protein
MKLRLEKYEPYLFFLVVLTGLLAMIFWYRFPASQEAYVRCGIATDLLSGAEEGRQGLIGSLVWAPLPTMLCLPFVKVPGLGRTGLAFAVVNAIISAWTLALLNVWWTRFGIRRRVRFPLLFVYQISPPVLGAVLVGTSTTLMLFLLVAGAYFLVHWLETTDLRSLAYLGAFSGLAVITRYEMSLVVLAVLVAIVLRVRHERTRYFRSATVLTYLIPTIYTGSLWLLANWLIMANPVFFLRGLWVSGGIGAEVRGMRIDWYVYVVPLLLLLAAWFHHRYYHVLAVRRSLTGAIYVVTLLGAVLWPYLTQIEAFFKPTKATVQEAYFGRHPSEADQVDEIVGYLEIRHPDAKVFVSGYTGYPFVQRSSVKDMFVHLMNLNLKEVERRTPATRGGASLFFLVPKPEGIYRWEDINLQAPRLFKDYVDYRLSDGKIRMQFVYAKEWPDWHLVEVTRAK